MTHPDSPYVSSVKAGPYTVRGLSVGGVYTTLQVPELSVVLDVGIPLRAFCGADNIFVSHGHVDHIGGLSGLLGVRGMMKKAQRPRVFMPAEIEEPLESALLAMTRMQRFPLDVDAIPMRPGDEQHLANNLFVRAFRTHHPVPSLGYQFLRRVEKLKPAYQGLAGHEIGARKRAGEPLFETRDHLELAYATDTLIRVLETCPALLESRVLILECTFLDDKKSLSSSRAGCHIHLDESSRLQTAFRTSTSFSCTPARFYSPREARRILEARLPLGLRERVQLLAPSQGPWL